MSRLARRARPGGWRTARGQAAGAAILILGIVVSAAAPAESVATHGGPGLSASVHIRFRIIIPERLTVRFPQAGTAVVSANTGSLSVLGEPRPDAPALYSYAGWEREHRFDPAPASRRPADTTAYTVASP